MSAMKGMHLRSRGFYPKGSPFSCGKHRRQHSSRGHLGKIGRPLEPGVAVWRRSTVLVRATDSSCTASTRLTRDRADELISTNVPRSLKRRLGCIGKDLMRGVALSKGSGLSIFQSYSGKHNTNIVLTGQVLLLTTALSFIARMGVCTAFFR